MFCQYVPDHVLEAVGDEKSLKLSRKLRAMRGKIRSLLEPSATDKFPTCFTYDMDSKEDPLPGRLVYKEDQLQGVGVLPQSAILACAEGLEYRTFLSHILKLNSMDDAGMDIIQSVRYGKDYNNAFFNGKQMCYGEGDGKLFVSFVKDKSVGGHEKGHCRVQHTANWPYIGDFGALNEHMADVFGICFEYWSKQLPILTADWYLGDECVGPEFPGHAIRLFKYGPAYEGDPQPKVMSEKKFTLQDNGGVHINSGIPNFAFYNFCVILAEKGVSVFNFEHPLLIWHRALEMSGKYTGFKGFAKNTIKAADELYRLGAEAKKAWQTVELRV